VARRDAWFKWKISAFIMKWRGAYQPQHINNSNRPGINSRTQSGNGPLNFSNNTSVRALHDWLARQF